MVTISKLANLRSAAQSHELLLWFLTHYKECDTIICLLAISLPYV